LWCARHPGLVAAWGSIDGSRGVVRPLGGAGACHCLRPSLCGLLRYLMSSPFVQALSPSEYRFVRSLLSAGKGRVVLRQARRRKWLMPVPRLTAGMRPKRAPRTGRCLSFLVCGRKGMWWWLGRPSVDFVFDEGGSGWNASSTMPRPTGEERLLLFELVDSRRVENTQATGHRDFASS
jgi:hypothetical protein